MKLPSVKVDGTVFDHAMVVVYRSSSYTIWLFHAGKGALRRESSQLILTKLHHITKSAQDTTSKRKINPAEKKRVDWPGADRCT